MFFIGAQESILETVTFPKYHAGISHTKKKDVRNYAYL
ncbi:hypothetical protein L541_4484 [Bordetella hinzii CA90 BAL1384]|uniref:Uncharacterized protein n=1 Tax=Bordetella hinzii OH87 BAL007II TaxID=1331262 RepID=A0ABR4R312_9BORD|nr:hypothetical protein L544_0842 [Bordetella hinzii OH87 BAL007II]KCB27297.1 hypothetical protein L541_4484 [Bordetella hinzii CA90 BAL1384]KCB30674.1 hypothetical protein L543_0842 [Bordetella hinzii L60]